MSIARTVCKGLGGFLFVTLLTAALLSFSLAQVTEYSILQPAVSGILEKRFSKMANETELQQIHATLLLQCQQAKSETVAIPEAEIEFKCAELSNAKSEQLPALAAKAAFDKAYYKNYGCSFVNCIATLQGPDKLTVMLSATANQFYSKVWLYLLLAAVGSAALMLAAAESWLSRLKSLGIGLVFVGLPYFAFKFVGKLLPPDVITEAGPITDTIVGIIAPKFLATLALGVIIAAVGFAAGYLQPKRTKGR